jgi:hypothetical protein
VRISVQFHAERREVGELVSGLAGRLGLHVTCEKFAEPYTVFVAQSPDELDVTDDRISRIGLSVNLPRVEFDRMDRFLEANPGLLTIYLGEAAGGHLGPNLMSGVSTEPKLVATWKKIKSATVAQLHKGAWVVGPTGARVYDPSHLYSDGALALSRAGVKMSALAGSAEYRFEGE